LDLSIAAFLAGFRGVDGHQGETGLDPWHLGAIGGPKKHRGKISGFFDMSQNS